ncbi:MAG: AEC family transporter [Clostridia bacterium]|nr:AEC family transporter [Clostridia bacterium]
MNFFTTTLISVAVMLAYAIPGFILVKVKSISQTSISAFAKVLMYICQPFLTIYAFNNVLISNIEIDNRILFGNLGIVLGISFGVMLIFITVFYLTFKKRYEDVRFRVATVAVAFGNCTFMGIPILEALFPNNPEVSIYSTVFFISMSLIGWTIASALISGDKKYIKIKNVLLNPAVLALVVALPLYLCNVKITGQINNMITILGKMTTPLCMLIVGMRFGAIKIKTMFTDPIQYLAIFIKLLVIPLFAILVVYFLNIDVVIKMAIVIMFATPGAAVILTFAEMLNNGQQTAVNIVVLSTMLSVVTLPTICLIVERIFI